METHQEKSSEVIIPVLEHGKLHFGSGRVSVLKIMIKIAISTGASLGPLTPSEIETHQQKSSEVIIPILEHGQLHFGSGRDSELNIMITIAISPRAALGP